MFLHLARRFPNKILWTVFTARQLSI